METALTALAWAVFVTVLTFGILGGVHISALTDRATAQAQAIRDDTKRQNGVR